MPRKDWCKHYNGLVNEACEAGVKYADVTVGSPVVGVRPAPLPCLGPERNPDGIAKCDKCEFRTPEEVAAYEAATKARGENTGKARAAIVAVAPWKRRGDPGHTGRINCPVCVAGMLSYSRAGYNGHIHAKCSTPGCVSWME